MSKEVKTSKSEQNKLSDTNTPTSKVGPTENMKPGTKVIVQKKLTQIQNKIKVLDRWKKPVNPDSMNKNEAIQEVKKLRKELEGYAFLETHRRLAGGNFILLTNYSAGDITPFRVQDEHTGLWKTNYGEKYIQMRTDPITVAFDATKFLKPMTKKGRIRRKLFGGLALKLAGIKNYGKFIFNLWLAEVTGEFTFPIKDQTPEQAKQEAERQNYISAKAKEGDWIGSMMSQIRRKENQAIIFAFILGMVGIVLIMGYFFSGGT